MKTVGELKEYLSNLPDDMLLLVYREDMETSGYQYGASIRVASMEKERRETWDRFDGTPYSYVAFVESPNGTPCLLMG